MKKLLWITMIICITLLGLLAAYETPAASGKSGRSAIASVDEREITARLLGGNLRVTVPVQWNTKLFDNARMTLRLVDLHGARLADTENLIFCLRKNQAYEATLSRLPEIPNSSLYSVEYSLKLSDGSELKGRKSLAESLGTLETRLIGSTEFLAGSKAGLRIVALDHSTGEPVPNASVSFAIKGEPKNLVLSEGYTDIAGTINAMLPIPAGLKGRQTLIVQVNSPIGRDYIESPITVKNPYKILLTTDKPLYQPGQTIHMRCLSLSAASLSPAGDEDITIEVQDAKGNKVFKSAQKTDKFGIAAADFVLADEVNTGLYKVRVSMGETAVEKDITVKHYVLPKFKIDFTTDKNYYLPGEKMRGEVQADYFFGKPVTNAVVVAKLSKFDVNFSEFARIEGTTDPSGHYSFEAELPEYFVGQPLQQGKAFVKLDIRIVDGADHKEEISRNVNIASDPLTIVAVPEAGMLVPGVENIVYIMTAYPDGKPAGASVDVRIDRAGRWVTGLKTDALGVTTIKLFPESSDQRITVAARDGRGNRTSKTIKLEARAGENQLLLRTSQALYRVGEVIHASILATKEKGAAYVDVIKDGQTVLTRTVELSHGRAELDIELSPDLSGSLQMNAYMITPASDIIRDSRLLYVNPANDLKIDVALDKETYRPGEDASISFTVRDKAGRPLLAALGVSIVDESVFALQEMQPGLEKVYFTLEKELMRPRYEIHGYTMDDMILEEPPAPEQISLRQEAARVLLASVETFWEPTLNTNSYDTKQIAYRAEIEKIMQAKSGKIEKALKRFHKRHDRFPTSSETLAAFVDERLLKMGDAIDPWGNFYRVDDVGFTWKDYISFRLLSAGPDEVVGTRDDVAITHQPFSEEKDWFRGAIGRVEEAVMAPMAKMRVALNGSIENEAASQTAGGDAAAADKAQVRIRKYFPETLYFNPAIITDQHGRARISLAMADSITTWRMASMASALTGAMGSTSTPIRVFQDFFIDIDLPVALTQNDRISIPVAVYNYLPDSQTIRLELSKEDWFDLEDDSVKEITLGSNDVSVVYFTVVARRVGRQNLTVHGLGTKMSDAVKRQILIVPDGKEFVVNYNDRLDGTVEKIIEIPQAAIDDASTILVKIYPGVFSQIVEGLDGILRMPFGCFEQTSSTTYPNVLVLDYMRATNQLSPQIRMKAEGFINTGYQRLLSFEVNGGGFDWFGNPPANQILTAYGLMEFSDMAKVHEVDPAVISRTQRWLISKQRDDGSWSPDQAYLHQESWSRIQNSNLPVTAYVAWALLESGYDGAETQKALSYIKAHLDEAGDAYVLALCANALVLADRNDDTALRRLVAMKIEENGAVHWESRLNTMTFSHGDSADIETTALAAMALLRSGRYGNIANEVMTYLIRSKDHSGTWHSTQATVLAMKAMVAALDNATEEADADIKISIDGEVVSTVKVTPADSDVMRLIDLKRFVHKGSNKVKLDFSGEGSMLYQVVGRYYLPWLDEQGPKQEPLTIDVQYDKTRLEKDDIVTCNVRVLNNRSAAANMLIVDLGVPPGFEVQPEALQKLVEQRLIEKYSLTGRQIIIYLSKIGPRAELSFSYQLRAKYPIKAKTPASRVYEYYDPSVENFAKPVVLEIKG